MEEIKNNENLQTEKTVTEALDEAMGVTGPDITDESGRIEIPVGDREVAIDEDNIIIQYASGISLTMSYTDMDWEGIWKNAVPDMLNNLAVLKQMYHDILITPDEAARNAQAKEAIDLVDGFFKSVGVPEINYELRPNISVVEHALCTITDCIILLYEVTHMAQVFVMMSKTDGMSIDQMVQQMSEEMKNFKFGGNEEKEEKSE